MGKLINAAIQVLPKTSKNDYDVVDKAIAVIQNSGLKYRVCPFETVVEGEYQQITTMIGKIQQTCFESGAESMLINIKLQISKHNDVHIEDKMAKYD